eukprot:m.658874 g.658874  ORF g.658874 m.658874 type:complete len:96 (-) comp58442_c0_seq15:76-363(-)
MLSLRRDSFSSGGTSAKVLQRSCLFAHPGKHGAVCVAAGDEASNSVMIWDSGDGALMSQLPSSGQCLDVCSLRLGSKDLGLAALCEGKLDIFSFS